ncbi:MAG: ComEA family DNA-binding protein [Panacagrimonas sp.]
MIKSLFAALLCMVSAGVYAGPVNVNKADSPTLAKELKGVGPSTGDAIVEERKNGPYKDEADLKKRVKGVGDKIIENNKGNLRFSD